MVRSLFGWKEGRDKVSECAFGNRLKIKIILLFNLFLLLFMNPTALFGTINGLHCIISTNFYIYSTFSNKFLISTK